MEVWRQYQICRLGLSMSFQIVNVFNRLTVFENVQVSVLSRLRRSFDLITPSKRVAVEETREILKSVGLLNVENRSEWISVTWGAKSPGNGHRAWR